MYQHTLRVEGSSQLGDIEGMTGDVTNIYEYVRSCPPLYQGYEPRM